MIITLNRTYLDDVIKEIAEKALRVQPADGELYDNAIRCVRNAFDAAEDYTARIITPSVVRIMLTTPPAEVIEMPTAPITKLRKVSVERKVVEGSEVVSNARRAILGLTSSVLSMVSTSNISLDVEAEVGYNAEELPGAIYQAVTIIAATFFDDSSATDIPKAAMSLLDPWRILPYGGQV